MTSYQLDITLKVCLKSPLTTVSSSEANQSVRAKSRTGLQCLDYARHDFVSAPHDFVSAPHDFDFAAHDFGYVRNKLKPQNFTF
jgi:hypothetical protein